MPCLKADFQADLIAELRGRLVTEQRWDATEVAAIDDSDICAQYFDARRRRVSERPRSIEQAAAFACPPSHQDGWESLQAKVRNGEDINPHLSKGHSSMFFSDGLLAEWGVHHFHLGTVLEGTHVKRTGPLLYALVTDNAFLAINVLPHGKFEDSSILESIHQNWPELISRYRVKRVSGGGWTQSQRRALRSKRANVLTAVADGTVYMPISGGVMASGMNAEAIRAGDYWLITVMALQGEIEAKLDELLPALRQNGYVSEPEIEAELRLSEEGTQVFFPRYNVLAVLTGVGRL